MGLSGVASFTSAGCWLSARAVNLDWALSIINQKANSGLFPGATELRENKYIQSFLRPMLRTDNSTTFYHFLSDKAKTGSQIQGVENRPLSLAGRTAKSYCRGGMNTEKPEE